MIHTNRYTVDVYGPGVGVKSSTPGGNYEEMDGTSMASPHVCGLGAVVMGSEGLEPGKVCDRLKEMAISAIKSAPSGTTDKLINNGAEE